MSTHVWRDIFTRQVSASGSNLVLSSGIGGTSVYVYASSTFFTPYTDGTVNLGAPSGTGGGRWGQVYSTVGTISTSVYEAKEDFGPLDQGECAQAVLETDWVSFRYKPPALTGEEDAPPGTFPEGDDAETREAKQDATRAAYAEALTVTAPARKQKGYVLQSPTHKVHDLFGLEDRVSASPGSDLAVVACALQGALQRIAALEGAGAPASTATATRTPRSPRKRAA